MIEGEDENVAEERNRVNKMTIEDTKNIYPVLIKNLNKEYGSGSGSGDNNKNNNSKNGKKIALKNLSLSMFNNECFGLLG